MCGDDGGGHGVVGGVVGDGGGHDEVHVWNGHLTPYCHM